MGRYFPAARHSEVSATSFRISEREDSDVRINQDLPFRLYLWSGILLELFGG